MALLQCEIVALQSSAIERIPKRSAQALRPRKKSYHAVCRSTPSAPANAQRMVHFSEYSLLSANSKSIPRRKSRRLAIPEGENSKLVQPHKLGLDIAGLRPKATRRKAKLLDKCIHFTKVAN